ncbi:uncharacterized protein I206_100768 [Kwoniella pini CBS 10737]|uniref:DNA-directed DNA polymerase family B exonuclease domain-containing protein n=1 Tax=Kwoniella pini CBS 10737 TaxID=1296096 RepID=A0AAJ8MLS9_9TREE
MVEPTNKKRKLEPINGHGQPALAKQESFSAVLEQLEAEEDASGDSIETSAAWPRPAAPKLNTQRDSIAFQQIELEEASEPKHGPTIRLFGVTERGNSVLAHVHGFKPYFYVAAPQGFLNKDLEPLKDKINQMSFGLTVTNCAIFNRRSLWGYRGDETVPFIKITCADPKGIPKVKDEHLFSILGTMCRLG